VDLVHAHVPGTFARAGKILKKVRTAARFETPLAKSLRGSLLRREMRLPSDSGIPIQKILTQKARGRFPGAGSKLIAMMNICR
jgi:hypothetical protein